MKNEFQFATCDRNLALRFLRQSYPTRIVEDTEESAKKVLDLVEKDIMRVQDPDCHKPSQMIAGTNWDESLRESCHAICQEFHLATLQTQKPAEVSE
jgi:hypothetical protein